MTYGYRGGYTFKEGAMGAGARVEQHQDGETPADAYLRRMIEGHDGISGCARCGGAHERLDWRRLTRPSSFGRETVTAWAICPTLDEPILFTVEHVEDDPPPASTGVGEVSFDPEIGRCVVRVRTDDPRITYDPAAPHGTLKYGMAVSITYSDEEVPLARLFDASQGGGPSGWISRGHLDGTVEVSISGRVTRRLAVCPTDPSAAVDVVPAW